MRVSRPIIQILRTIKTNDNKSNSLLDTVIKYLYDVEKMSVAEIAAVLEIGIGSIYKTLKKDIS
jgi:AcrR family transcriptional regulator